MWYDKPIKIRQLSDEIEYIMCMMKMVVVTILYIY